jgi:hypothetical protein
MLDIYQQLTNWVLFFSTVIDAFEVQVKITNYHIASYQLISWLRETMEKSGFRIVPHFQECS